MTGCGFAATGLCLILRLQLNNIIDFRAVNQLHPLSKGSFHYVNSCNKYSNYSRTLLPVLLNIHLQLDYIQPIG